MVTCRLCRAEVEKYANGKRCRDCYNEYMAEYMLRRYHERRTEAVALLGGHCVICNTADSLEFDHVDRKTKEGDIAKLWSGTREKFLEELSKCQLLCKEHHKEKTLGEISVEHGGGLTGKYNCRCDLCGPLKKAYQESYYASHL